MPQLLFPQVHDPVIRLRWIAVGCAAGGLSVGIGLAAVQVSWMQLRLMAAAAPILIIVLVLMLYTARRLMLTGPLEERRVGGNLHESER